LKQIQIVNHIAAAKGGFFVELRHEVMGDLLNRAMDLLNRAMARFYNRCREFAIVRYCLLKFIS
jgi:hypothetical protein